MTTGTRLHSAANGNARPVGTFQKEMLIIGAEGLTLAMFTRVLGWDKKEVDVFVASVREALKDPVICAYTRL